MQAMAAPQGYATTPLDISADGRVAVGLCGNSGVDSPIIWRDGQAQIIDIGPDYGSGLFWGVSSDASTAVGSIYTPFNGITAYNYGFAYRGHGLELLSLLPSTNSSTAVAVSANGSVIVGSCSWSGDVGGQSYACRWVNGQAQRLGEASLNASAVAVSAAGSFVAGQGFEYGAGESVPGESNYYRWDAQGNAVVLGHVTNGAAGITGMTGDGQMIIGNDTVRIYPSGQMTVPWVWDVDHGMRNLNVALTDWGVNTDGWQITEIDDISSDGRFITGLGTQGDGQWQAVVIEVPEPATMSLLVIGGLAMWPRRK